MDNQIIVDKIELQELASAFSMTGLRSMFNFSVLVLRLQAHIRMS